MRSRGGWRSRWWVAWAWLIILTPHGHAGRPTADHVVIVVCDGLRPDSITETDMPTLSALAREGVRFTRHVAEPLSSTVANTAALATGSRAGRNGILANREYRPALDPLRALTTTNEVIWASRRVPTIAEALNRHDRKTVVVGARANAQLVCPGAIGRVVLEGNRGRPESLVKALIQRLGVCPASYSERDHWAARALVGPLWDEELPALSVLWLNQPDAVQHEHGVGTPPTREVLRRTDELIGMVWTELKARGVWERTVLMVMSDHGFSTISRSVDLVTELERAGFRAQREFQEPPQVGDVLVVHHGTAVLFYVVGRDAGVVQRLVTFLQQQDYTGVVLARAGHEGAFTLAQLGLETAEPPDVVLSLRWDEQAGAGAVAGRSVAARGTRGVGQGAHGGLSRFDLAATLVMAGRGVRRGWNNPLPSSTADLAPTALHILGVPVPNEWEGRVLSEALVDEQPAGGPVEVQTLETAAIHGPVRWTQYVQVVRYSGRLYVLEGNGAATSLEATR
ncbi:MAG: alkaline phosphatase family protein [Verrucomicrobiae bacterium]|nr:alkaline phosphatase family protein [Verrucomicrobiae bacterium]